MSSFVTNTSHKSRTTALILCLLLGLFGGHCYYVGRIGKGIFYTLTLGFFGIGTFIDLVKILLGTYKDANGYPLIEW